MLIMSVLLCIMLMYRKFKHELYVVFYSDYRRDTPPFSGGHGVTIPDRGFWLSGGGPWLAVASAMG